MNKNCSSTAVDQLKEFAHSGKQDGTHSPPHTRSSGSAAADTLKAGSASDRSGKLTLEQISAQPLQAITSCNTSFTGKMEEIKVDISLLRQDMQRVCERVAETELRISTLEDDFAPVLPRVAVAEKQISFKC